MRRLGTVPKRRNYTTSAKKVPYNIFTHTHTPTLPYATLPYATLPSPTALKHKKGTMHKRVHRTRRQRLDCKLLLRGVFGSGYLQHASMGKERHTKYNINIK